MLGGSGGLSKSVNNGDNWGFYMAYRGDMYNYEAPMPLQVRLRLGLVYGLPLKGAAFDTWSSSRALSQMGHVATSYSL